VSQTATYELTTQGGATDFGRLIAACESFGLYCLSGWFGRQLLIEPVYTLDADIVTEGWPTAIRIGA
jgi:hypothetical protein